MIQYWSILHLIIQNRQECTKINNKRETLSVAPVNPQIANCSSIPRKFTSDARRKNRLEATNQRRMNSQPFASRANRTKRRTSRVVKRTANGVQNGSCPRSGGLTKIPSVGEKYRFDDGMVYNGRR